MAPFCDMRCDETLLIQARFPKFVNVQDGTGFGPMILVLNDLVKDRECP
jgi:hypothetical protein